MTPAFVRAFNRFRAGEVEAAMESCRAALAADPADALSSFLLGIALLRRGSVEEGRERIASAFAQSAELDRFDAMTRGFWERRGEIDESLRFEARLLDYLRSRDTDGFVISFPKCGRTWLRLLLGKYVAGFETVANPFRVWDLTYRSPRHATVQVSHDDYPHWRRHGDILRDKSFYAEKKVIFLVRDPRDVVVSNYFQFVKRGDARRIRDGFSGSLSDFLRYEIGSLKSVVTFYNVWACNRSVPRDFKLISYEDLKGAPLEGLLGCVDFLGWPRESDDHCRRVVDYCRFDNMRKLEEERAFDSVELSPPKDGDPEGFKVRKGRIGGYRDYLCEDDVAYMNRFIAEELDPLFGYGREHVERTD